MTSYLLRKLIHIFFSAATVLGLLWFYHHNSMEFAQQILLMLLLIFLIIDYARIEYHWELWLYHKTEKKREHTNIHAITQTCIAIVLSLFIFPFPIALTAISMSLFGDVAAALVGKSFGTLKIHKQKSAQGSLAMLIVCCLLGYYFLRNPRIFVPMALTATVIEAFTDRMEDNLVLPIVTGFVGKLLS